MTKYGYIKSPADLRDYKINKAYKQIELPEEYELSNLPKVKDQGYISSCVAHAVSSVLEANDNINYSTGWIYGYRPATYWQGEGMITQEALRTINKMGYVPNEDFNYNTEVPEAIELVKDNLKFLAKKANEKKIPSYARLKGERDIKTAIFSADIPVLIAIDIGVDGLILQDGIAEVPKKFDGGHQLMCYGWNKDGYLIQNSWGSTWGNKGRFILPYDYPISEAWVINFPTEDTEDMIVKPTGYMARKIFMWLYKFLKKLFKNMIDKMQN